MGQMFLVCFRYVEKRLTKNIGVEVLEVRGYPNIV